MKSSSHLSRHVLLFITILALASQACAITLFDPSSFFPTPSSPTGGLPPTPAPRAQVTFNVQLPEPLAAGETLALSVLDEVTGLALNPIDYQMTPKDAAVYTAVLTIPDQAIVKYRYVRRGATRVTEDTNADAAIRYRLLHVNSPIEVMDVISSWADKPANTISGTIFGTILNADTGAPIPEIMVTAGGAQTLTDSAGRFQLIGLRGGNHMVVAYALDGTFQTFQQGATVEGNKGTPVEIRMKPAPLVNVIFTVSVPQNTQRGVPLRMAGNLLQFGNAFADLRGGLSTLADRMPVMTPLPDGRYSVSMFLPAGAFLEYKYTLGDGFWNSEFNSIGQYVTRQLLIPSQNVTINDEVQSWQAGPNAPILFEVTVPQNTPSGDVIYIQFNPYGWTHPIAMWRMGPYDWAYKLYGPLNIIGSFGYRFCRNAQCGSADDAATAGDGAHGRNVSPSIAAQNIKDTVNQWAWRQDSINGSLVQTSIPSRGTGFLAGVEFLSYYDPSLPTFVPYALQNIQAFNSNWVIYTPSWTYARNNPLVFSQQPGRDPFMKDTKEAIAAARALNMNVALFPQPRFTPNKNDFWRTAPRDATWWDAWFNHYRAFAVHFADLATQSNAQAVILGGDWIAPALPAGRLADGTPSGVPADAEARWKIIIAEVRQHFRGNVLFALPYDNTVIPAPVNILQDTDGIYLLWFVKLSDQANPGKTDMLAEAGRLLDENIFPVQSQVGKPVIIGLSYPSAGSSATGCIPDGSGGCYDWSALSRPNADIGTVSLNLQLQFDIYDAMFNAVNSRPWVSGLVSRGYYPPAELHDKSASVHGKPAANLLWYWFPRLLGIVK
jgi:hypothetical protein